MLVTLFFFQKFIITVKRGWYCTTYYIRRRWIRFSLSQSLMEETQQSFIILCVAAFRFHFHFFLPPILCVCVCVCVCVCDDNRSTNVLFRPTFVVIIISCVWCGVVWCVVVLCGVLSFSFCRTKISCVCQFHYFKWYFFR